MRYQVELSDAREGREYEFRVEYTDGRNKVMEQWNGQIAIEDDFVTYGQATRDRFTYGNNDPDGTSVNYAIPAAEFEQISRVTAQVLDAAGNPYGDPVDTNPTLLFQIDKQYSGRLNLSTLQLEQLANVVDDEGFLNVKLTTTKLNEDG